MEKTMEYKYTDGLDVFIFSSILNKFNCILNKKLYLNNPCLPAVVLATLNSSLGQSVHPLSRVCGGK